MATGREQGGGEPIRHRGIVAQGQPHRNAAVTRKPRLPGVGSGLLEHHEPRSGPRRDVGALPFLPVLRSQPGDAFELPGAARDERGAAHVPRSARRQRRWGCPPARARRQSHRPPTLPPPPRARASRSGARCRGRGPRPRRSRRRGGRTASMPRSGVRLRGGPIRLPSARTQARPARARPTRRSRSNSATLDCAAPGPAGGVRTPPEAVSLDLSRRAERQARPGGLRPTRLDAMVDTGSDVALEVQAAPERFADEPIAARRMAERLRAPHGATSGGADGRQGLRRGAVPRLVGGARSRPMRPRSTGEAHAPPIDRRHRTGAIRRAACSPRTPSPDGRGERHPHRPAGRHPEALQQRGARPAPPRLPSRERGARPIEASGPAGTMRAPRAARPTRRSASGSEPIRAPRPSAVRCGCARPPSPCSATIRAPRRAVPPPAAGPARRRRAGRARRHRPQPRAHGPVGRPPIVEGRDGGVGTPLGGRLGGTARAEPTCQQPTAMATAMAMASHTAPLHAPSSSVSTPYGHATVPWPEVSPTG